MNGRDHEERYALPIYPRRGVTIVRGEGALLWDDQGTEYLAAPLVWALPTLVTPIRR